MSIEKLDLTSPDLVNQNIEKLAALFPNCVTEGADGKVIDFDLLKQELNNEVIEGKVTSMSIITGKWSLMLYNACETTVGTELLVGEIMLPLNRLPSCPTAW